MPIISIQRAKYFTEKWREAQAQGLPLQMAVALSMKHVYENMDICVDPDDRLAGSWTEHFLGLPIDIERGLFNGVLENELDRRKMMAFQGKAYLRLTRYLLKKHGPIGLVRQLKKSAQIENAPVGIGLKTLSERPVNAFTIDPKDKNILQKELLPYWKGRSIADRVNTSFEEAGIYDNAMCEFVKSMPNTPSKQALIVSAGAAIATYQGHLILDHERAIRKGFLVLREEAHQAMEETDAKDAAGREFLEAQVIALDGLIVYATRLADRIELKWQEETDPEQKKIFEQLLTTCRRAPLHPAKTFEEAVQAFWTVKIAVELANITNVHAAGRLDQLFYPYYQEDLAEGRIVAEEARELLEELLLKVMTNNLRPESNLLGNFYLRYEGSTPVTIGGLKPDGSDATNDLTYLLLEAAGRSRTVTSVVLRVHEKTPEGLYQKVAEVLHEGSANLSLMNDEVFIPAMKRRGFSEEDSRDYAITGCTDALCPGKTGGISFSGLLLVRTLDMTLHNGDAMTLLGTLKDVGLKTGMPAAFQDFEELLEAFLKQIDNMIRLNVEASNLRDKIFAEQMPAPFISAFIDGCLENKKDVTQGGATYDFSGINMINSVANVVDSLYVIRKLVFEQKRITLSELMAAVDDNFNGHGEILRLVKEVPGKWGNGNPETDELAVGIMSRVFAEAEKHKSYKGGPFVPFINSMTSHTVDGRMSGATPDGRRAATPFASSCNPYNVEEGGITGVLRSVSALDYEPLLGCAVNLRLHPSALGRSSSSRKKWTSLMRTYFKMGGAQIQPTVASADTLRAAQKEPDDYRDLIVKVGGYSTYFVHLGPEIQNEVIARTEHGCIA